MRLLGPEMGPEVSAMTLSARRRPAGVSQSIQPIDLIGRHVAWPSGSTHHGPCPSSTTPRSSS